MAVSYIDLSVGVDGDGTVAGPVAGAPGGVGPFNTFVAHLGTGGDTIWVRRAGTLTIAASINFNVAVTYIGWPISTDDDYATRTASGIANGWDADSNSAIATINATDNTKLITSSSTAYFKRLSFTTTELAQPWITVSAASSFKYCNISNAASTNNGNMVSCTNAAGNILLATCSFSVAGVWCALSQTGAGTVQIYDCNFTKTIPTDTANVGTISLSTGGSVEIIRTTVTHGGGGGSCGTCLYIGNGLTSIPVIIDCKFDNSAINPFAGYTIIFNCAAVVRNCAVLGSGVTTTASGNPTRWNLIHLSKLTQTIANTSGALALAALSEAIFYVANLTAFPGNTNADITLIEGVTLILSNPIFSHPTKFTTVTVNTQNLTTQIGDYNGAVGAFYSQNMNGTIRGSSVFRTGGSPFSLRFEFGGRDSTLTSSAYVPLEFGLPGMETVFAPVKKGPNTITLYGAYRGYTVAPTNDDIWFDTSYVSSIQTAATTGISSGASTALTTDSSVWSSPGLTSFKLVVSFTAGMDCAAPIRIKMSKMDPNGLILIDPLAVVS